MGAHCTAILCVLLSDLILFGLWVLRVSVPSGTEEFGTNMVCVRRCSESVMATPDLGRMPRSQPTGHPDHLHVRSVQVPT